ncbi:MAG: zinc-ribbon domain-containing protein [Butyrivibrio sp.]|nr:zinc-ribbon domain-containing protein [Butyrivibrio sp.]
MKNVADKEISELTKNIQTAQMRITNISAAIGRAYYMQKKEAPEPEFAQMFADMASTEKQIEQMQTRIKFLNGIVVCTNCKADNSVNSAFCAACGSRLPHTFTADGANRCTRCGNIINPGQLFCGSCGQKVENAQSAPAPQPEPAPAAAAEPTPAPVVAAAPTPMPAAAAEPAPAPVPVAEPVQIPNPAENAAVQTAQEQTFFAEAAAAAENTEQTAQENACEQFTEPQNEAAACCPNCGTPIKVMDALFCAECGTRLR